MATVLIVDDNRLEAQLIEALLQRRTRLSVYAKNDAEAIRLLNEDGPFHLVIATISAAGATELSLLDRIRSTPALEDLPIVLCADRGQSVIVREAASLRVSGFVLKPIKAKYFLDTIDRALTNSMPLLRDRGRVQRDLHIDLHGYQRLALHTVQDIEHALHGLAVTDRGLDAEIVESLEALRDDLHSVGAYRVLPPLDTALRLTADPASALGRPVIRDLAVGLRQIQAALLAVA